MSDFNGKERREDRKEAREQKKEDIANGESRKDARKDKHAVKKADRQVWKDEKHSIGDDIAEFGLDTVEGVAEGLSYTAAMPMDVESLGKVNGDKDDGEKNS